MQSKQQFRQAAFAVRDSIEAMERASLSALSCSVVQPLLEQARAVMLYSPIRSELDVSGLVPWLWQRGIKTLLPVVCGKHIVAAEYNESTRFSKGAYGIDEPVFEQPYDPLGLDAIIVPGIAFTREGGRMGYGAGYYDGFLKKTRGLRIGMCFPQQVYAAIPTESHDESMHLLIAGAECIHMQRGRG